MQFFEPGVADLLRCTQRDQAIISDLEGQLHSFLKHLNARTYHSIRSSVPLVAHFWYYYTTSVRNLQTLGEEYTGTLRLTRDRKVPTKLVSQSCMDLPVDSARAFSISLCGLSCILVASLWH